ncbi:MAG: hypothetical protein GEU78_02200 [Actinobacteria bacterium]|nr:hypothetical protein [Actinomycetota bacterium]
MNATIVTGGKPHHVSRRMADPGRAAPTPEMMRDRIELDSLSGDLIRVVIQTLQPAHASLWLKNPSKEEENHAMPDDGRKTLSQSVS